MAPSFPIKHHLEVRATYNSTYESVMTRLTLLRGLIRGLYSITVMKPVVSTFNHPQAGSEPCEHLQQQAQLRDSLGGLGLNGAQLLVASPGASATKGPVVDTASLGFRWKWSLKRYIIWKVAYIIWYMTLVLGHHEGVNNCKSF